MRIIARALAFSTAATIVPCAMPGCDDGAKSAENAVDMTFRPIQDTGLGLDGPAELTDATPLDLGLVPDGQFIDAGVADARPLGREDTFIRPDAPACAPTTLPDRGGAALLSTGVGDVTTESGATWWRITAIDQRGRPLAGATASIITSADAFTLVVHAPGHLAAVLNAPLADGTFGINAARQATEGPGTKDVLGASEVPSCAVGANFISVLAALAPLPDRIGRELAGDALFDACRDSAEPPESPACVSLRRVLDTLTDLPARMRLAVDSHPAYAMAALPRVAGPAAAALGAESCATPWGVAPVAFVDERADVDPNQAPFERWRRLAATYTDRSGRLSPDDAAGADRLVRFGTALARLAGPASRITYDLVVADASLATENSLISAAVAVRAVVAAGDAVAPAGLMSPYLAFAANGPALIADAFAFARSEQPAGAYGLGPAALCDLTLLSAVVETNAALTVEAGPAISGLLDVLEAAGEPEPPPPPADAGVAPIPDAASPEQDAAPVEPAGACSPDDSEPNQSWEQEVVAGERLGRNIVALDRRTLEPGDEDWYDFESGLINPHVSATISADNTCDEGSAGRLCAEMQWYTWASELLEDFPIVLVERQCFDLADGLTMDAGGLGGLAGEEWTSFLVHVTEDADAPLAGPVGFRIRVTR